MTALSTRSTTARRTDGGIQSLRGIAVLLMVTGHVIGSGPGRGLDLPDDSLLGWGYSALEDVRMPLFTVVSGFVYGYRPLSSGASLTPLVRGKVRRLLVPLVVVGTSYFLVQAVVPGTSRSRSLDELWTVYVLPYEHFWFLQAIFLIFLVVGALDAAGALRTHRRFALAVLLACVAHVAFRLPAGLDVFSVNGALRLLPFFLVGYGAHLFGVGLTRKAVTGLALWLLVSYGSWAALPVAGVDLGDGAASRALSLSIGLPAVALLLGLRRHLQFRPLAVIGGFSFGIYLLHVFGTAGARLSMAAVGVESTGLLFAGSLAVGVTAPIIFERLAGHLPVVSWGVLGQRPLRRARAGHRQETLGPTGDSLR